ncbi:hypothetical protein ASPZODRAFT_1502396 [Penicilliopsis zonata CBS 506.65]|uniref:Apple domain-containing protein n=1 Tax=Penicilliopsis zonata CBS 506.65 TaxID=1073090 RepID=A0A1L9S532_9EURO|nr:hypothetical protein ASPZODRAFT_1502396 [Penicilliopsis zonata CBS 506.65]OJJ42253.1 hypothetical protein ASPZODRAFT_1502396 [Penicilliopsis zonata CBS 506.65]
MSLYRIALTAGFLLGQAAANVPIASSSAASQPSFACWTDLGTESVASIPTSTATKTIHDANPVIVYTTTQDTVTVTPAASTVTLTDYATTTVTDIAGTLTDTFSTTSTEYDTATVTVTADPITATLSITVSVTATSTSTIGTSSGFIPIADSLTGTTVYKRDVSETSCPLGHDDYQYATSVECVTITAIKTTTTETVTAAASTVTAASETSTVSTTSTITSSTTMVAEEVSTTLSYSTTSTITETSTAPAVTSTVTATTTVTAAVSTTSVYGACATDNLAGAPLSSLFGSLAGEYIQNIYATTFAETLSSSSSASAYDCCVSCQENSACMYSAWYDSYCYIVTSSVCSVSTYYGTADLVSSSATWGYVVSNGNCARVVS